MSCVGDVWRDRKEQKCVEHQILILEVEIHMERVKTELK